MPATLGLSTYRWNNNIKSVLLLLAFPFLLLALVAGIFYVWGWLNAGPHGEISPYLLQNLGFTEGYAVYWSPYDFALAAVLKFWPVVLGVAVVWVLIGYFFNDAMIHAATGARAITRQEAPELYNILENICISRGLKMPKLYIMESPEMNAFASGLDEKSYSVTVTRGILERLSKEEMEAVLAHEVTHIVNRDVRLLIVTVVFVGMISFLAQMVWRSMRFAAYTRSNSRDRNGGGAVVLMLIAGIMLGVGYMLALMLRFALSRKREYLADAGSVEITKNPEALISALRKIAEDPDVRHVPPEVKQMFIENPPTAADFFGLFATHPPIEDRIHVLEELGGLPPEGKSVIPASGD